VTLYTGHGGSCTPLSFTPGNIAGTRVEAKVCELCTRMFFRESYPAQAPSRDCDRCIAREKLRRAQEARELLVARQPLERPAGGWAQQTKMMPQ
jgi:hypothetical protein